MPENPREIAAELLSQRRRGVFLEALFDSILAQHKLSREDRRFLQELVYGAVRWERTLDWLIARKASAQAQKPLVQNLLRLALYQMFWLDRVPSYAAVNESVEICKRRGFVPQARFVNALLRGYTRALDATRQELIALRATDPALGFSHPDWLCRRWSERFGPDATRQLLEWNNSPPPVFARVNTLQGDSAALLAQWETEGVRAESVTVDWAPAGLLFKLASHPPLTEWPSFLGGGFYVQDPSTLLAVRMLDPQPGETLLDVCAAPGGKTTFAAQAMTNQGRIQAEDLDPHRLKLVFENAARLGASSIRTGDPDPATGYDRVLVDAPCSNTGVIRRRVELRWRIKPEEIQRLAKTQLDLLRISATRLRPGGVLVYSTCSLEREENEAVVRAFLAGNSRFSLEAERTLTPMRERVDGAYCARLIFAPAET